jgi:hypothetical protein
MGWRDNMPLVCMNTDAPRLGWLPLPHGSADAVHLQRTCRALFQRRCSAYAVRTADALPKSQWKFVLLQCRCRAFQLCKWGRSAFAVRTASALHMHSHGRAHCQGRAIAVHMQCRCRAFAAQMQCVCSADAVHLQCICSAYAVQMQCKCFIQKVDFVLYWILVCTLANSVVSNRKTYTIFQYLIMHKVSPQHLVYP